ncbi:hypothetical protein SH467x_004161 [Pirellulaceae bacterium SH467]
MREADVFVVQPWFTVKPELLEGSLANIAIAFPTSKICFLDSYAHSDLRLAKYVDPYIHYYCKKSLFRDHEDYLRAFRGDTNLTEFYGDRYGFEAVPVDWEVPRSILAKLRLWPNFFTAPQFISSFSSRFPPSLDGRIIDVHARLGTKGSPWYQMMREESVRELQLMPSITSVFNPDASWGKYLRELKQSKICFSPFGYGELCWRDIEAFLTGAVLVKPDMSHLITAPDLFVPNETYVPIRWDFQDLTGVIQRVLEDDSFRKYVASQAYERIRGYISARRFVDDVEFLAS